MATTTYQQQLEEIQAVITQVQTTPNASVSILGRSFTKHDLEALYRIENQLRVKAARASRGGRRVQRIVPI